MDADQMTFIDAWILDLGDCYTRHIKMFSREKILTDILRLTESLTREESERKCFKCGGTKRQADGKFLKCLGCLRASYCEVTCQTLDWPRHRGYCLVLQEGEGR